MNHNISNRYHQSTLNEDLGLMQDEDACLDRTTFDQIRNEESDEGSAAEDSEDGDSVLPSQRTRNHKNYQRQDTQPPTSIVGSKNVSNIMMQGDDAADQSAFSSDQQKLQAYFQAMSMSSQS